MVMMLSWSGRWKMEESFEHVCKFQRQNQQWRRDLRWDTEGTTQKHRSREIEGNEAELMGGDKNNEWLPDPCHVRRWGVRQEGVWAEVSWDRWEQELRVFVPNSSCNSPGVSSVHTGSLARGILRRKREKVELAWALGAAKRQGNSYEIKYFTQHEML